MSVLNPKVLRAVPPTERINDQPVVSENIYLEAGFATDPAGPFTVFDAEREDGDGTSDRVDGQVTFDLTAARLSGALPDGVSFVTARAVEERPDLATEEFPDGVDLLSAWAENPAEIRVANPPKAPQEIAVAA